MKFSFKTIMGNKIEILGYSLIIVIIVFILHNLYKVINKENFITLGGIPEAPLDASGNPLVPRNSDGVILPQTMPNDLNGKPLLPLTSSIDGKSINYSNNLLAFISIPVILTYLRSLVGKPEFVTAMISVREIVNLYVPTGRISKGADVTINNIKYSERPSNALINIAATAKVLGITEPEVSASIALSTTPVVNLSASENLKITSSSTVPYSDPQYGNAQILKGGSNITISTTNLPETCTRFKWFLNGNVLPDCTSVNYCKFNATTNLLPPDVSNTNIVNLTGYNSVGFACNDKLISRIPIWFN